MLEGLGWSAVYLLLVAAPLLMLLIGPAPPGVSPVWDFAMALGFGGMAIMGLQFALTARFRRATAPFGPDIIYYFHRLVAYLGAVLILAHFALLRWRWPEALGALNPLEAPAHMTAGRTALALFAVVIVTSVWRRRLGIEYRRWRILHAVLATLGFALAIVHIEGAGYYSHAPGTRWMWLAYTLFWLALVLHVRALRPWGLARRPWRVVEVRPERGRAWTVAVEPDGHDGLRFAPGQFAWLTLGGTPWRFDEHPFSFSSSAERGDRIEFTIKALGDFTRGIGEVGPGTRAWVDGPYGVFTPDRHPRARGFVLVAGGIGIAPIMSMLRTLADRGDARPVWLFHADSTWEDVTFREELESLLGRIDLRVTSVIERPPAGFTGAVGRIRTQLFADALPADRSALECFLCGPKGMCEAAAGMLRELGVRSARIHYELFEMV